ncbi:MAG: hypothetical protein ABFR50_03180 [Candidatus Fermentibacteria bacterium]
MRKSILRAQARAVRGRGAVFHASAAAHNAKGILFLAPSGGGKSTAAEILAGSGFDILGDDSTIISRGTDDIWRVIPCASWTWQSGRRPEAVELESLILLEKGEPGVIARLNPLYAAYRILRERSLMAYRDITPEERPAFRNAVSEICGRFPVCILRYSDPGSLTALIETIGDYELPE